MKLLALDMDGTCLNSYSKISPTTMDALYLARTSGIEIDPTTGRALSCIPHQLRKTGLFRYVISSNGAVAVDLKERKTLFRALMPYEAAATIIESCQGPDLKMAAHIRSFSFSPKKPGDVPDASCLSSLSFLLPAHRIMRKFIPPMPPRALPFQPWQTIFLSQRTRLPASVTVKMISPCFRHPDCALRWGMPYRP